MKPNNKLDDSDSQQKKISPAAKFEIKVQLQAGSQFKEESKSPSNARYGRNIV